MSFAVAKFGVKYPKYLRQRVNPVSGVDKYAAKDDFVFRATGYIKTKFEATLIPHASVNQCIIRDRFRIMH